MMASYLIAGLALAMITGVALGQSPSLATASPGSMAGGITTEASNQPDAHGNGVVGQFWTTMGVKSSMRNDDVLNSVQLAQPVAETASR